MSRRRISSLIVGALVGAAACGGDGDAVETTVATADSAEPTDASVAASGDDEFCGPMEDLANYNANAPDLDATSEWEDIKATLIANAEEAFTLYDNAIAVAPDEVRGDLQLLNDYSRDALTAAEESGTIEEFAQAVGAPPEDVITATTDLNNYILETCGFGLTSG